MTVYKIKGYGWYDEAMDKIQTEPESAMLKTSKNRKELKEKAKKIKKTIIIWKEIEETEDKITEKTVYTINDGKKIHITRNAYYAKDMAIKAEFKKQNEELKKWKSGI